MINSDRCSCGSCRWVGVYAALGPVEAVPAKLTPGDTIPAGICPSCDNYAYPCEGENHIPHYVSLVYNNSEGRIRSFIRMAVYAADCSHAEELLKDELVNYAPQVARDSIIVIDSFEQSEKESQ